MEEIKRNSKLKKFNVIIVAIVITLLVVTSIFVYCYLKPKIKESLQVEIGTQSLQIEDFFENSKFLKNAEFITNISEINLKEVGEHKINIKYKNKEYETLLKLVDTTPPTVNTYESIEVLVGEEVIADNFIISKNDLSQMETKIIEEINTSKVGQYEIDVIVTDQYGNETKNKCNLNVTNVRKEYNHELGEKIDFSNVIYEYDKHQDSVNEE